MRNVTSSASIVWEGNVARGSGTITAETGVFSGLPVDLPTRIGEAAGEKTTPEELLAASHVACLTMSLGTVLAGRKTPAERIEATSRVVLDMSGERTTISVVAEMRGTVAGLDEAAFQEAVKEAEAGCLISRVMRSGNIAIEATGTLV